MRARSIAERRAPQTTTTEATSARASERIDPTRARVSDRSVRRGEASEERTREGIDRESIDRSADRRRVTFGSRALRDGGRGDDVDADDADGGEGEGEDEGEATGGGERRERTRGTRGCSGEADGDRSAGSSEGEDGDVSSEDMFEAVAKEMTAEKKALRDIEETVSFKKRGGAANANDDLVSKLTERQRIRRSC